MKKAAWRYRINHKRPWLWMTLFALGIGTFSPIPGGCEIVRVGVIRMEFAHISPHLSNSIKMALENVRQQGILGNQRELQFVERYVPSDAKKDKKIAEAKKITEALISQERVCMLLTTVPEHEVVIDIAKLANIHQVPLLVCLSAEDSITEQGWEYVFRLSPPASEYFNEVLHFLTMVVKPRTFACLIVKDLNTMVPTTFANEKRAGIDLVLLQQYSKDTNDFRPLLGELKGKNPDVVYLISYPKDGALLLQQCRELNITPKAIIGYVAYSSPEFWNLAGEATEYIFAPTNWNPSLPYPGARDYHERFLKRYKAAPDYLSALTYSAVQVVADACRRARSTRPADMREALASTDMISILGRIKFVSYGKKAWQNRLPWYLVQWIDGKTKIVWPPRFSSHAYIYPFPGWKKPGQASTPSKIK